MRPIPTRARAEKIVTRKRSLILCERIAALAQTIFGKKASPGEPTESSMVKLFYLYPCNVIKVKVPSVL